MGVLDFIGDKIRSAKASREGNDLMDDDMTRDHHLRSLRREKRILMEEYEKRHLQKEIADMKKMRTSRNIFGSKDPNMPAEEEHRLLRPRHEEWEEHHKISGHKGTLGKYNLRGGGKMI